MRHTYHMIARSCSRLTIFTLCLPVFCFTDPLHLEAQEDGTLPNARLAMLLDGWVSSNSGASAIDTNDAITQTLVAAGDHTIELVRQRYVSASPEARHKLTELVGATVGVAAEDWLLTTGLSDTNRFPRSWLLLYPRAKGGLSVALDEAGRRALLDQARNGSNDRASAAAYFAARCKCIAPAEAAEAVATGFSARIHTPYPRRLYPSTEVYIASDVQWFNAFQRSIETCDPQLMLSHLTGMAASAESAWAKQWLAIGRLWCGDKSSSAEVLAIIEDASVRVSLRAVALRAYAHSMRQSALPVLEKYRNNTNTDIVLLSGPPLGIVAFDEFHKLSITNR